jgi:hypothetical protein
MSRPYPPAHLFIGRWGFTGIMFGECHVCGKSVNSAGRAPRCWLRAFVRFLAKHRHCGFA